MTAGAWGLFIALIAGLLVLDLGVLNRSGTEFSFRRAAAFTAFSFLAALSFGAVIFYGYQNHSFGLGLSPLSTKDPQTAAAQYLSGWLIEQSLSLDNIFVIGLIFNYFRVPQIYQHRVLFWGIVGAVLMRGAVIALGTALVSQFQWILYVFGIVLIYSAVKMLRGSEEQFDPESNLLYRLANRVYPTRPDFDGHRFFSKLNGRTVMTPLFLVLLVVESTDLIFAFDSIPAIFAITNDPFIIFTSNIFAIINLRSLYFVLASVVDRFEHLKTALLIVLIFVGIKLLLHNHVEIGSELSLIVITTLLGGGILLSLIQKPKDGSSSPPQT